MNIGGSQILLAGFGGLGDLLVTAPSMAYLRRILPDRAFALLCRGGYGEFFRTARSADRIVPLEGREAAALFASSEAEDADAGSENLRFGAIVGWVRKPLDPGVRSAFERRAPGNCHIIEADGKTAVPFSRFFFEATKRIFPAPDGRAPDFDECARIDIPQDSGSGPRDRKRRVVIHPGSGGRSKCWPLGGYLEIARRLAGKGVPGVLVTGEAEERPEIAGRLEIEPPPSDWTWERRPALVRLARLLTESGFYIGNDSGVTHLAAACGTPVLALFRREGLPAWRPFGRTRVLSAPEPAGIGIEPVWAELENFFLQSSFHLL